MQLRKGYKQTEVGVIPDEWELRSFRDICRVNQGLQIAIEMRLRNATLKSKKYITIQFLNNRKDVEYIDTYSPSVCCSESDVLMTRTGNTGIVVTGVEGVFHNNFFKINFDKSRLLKEYLVSYLSSSRTRKAILTKAGTSTIPDLNHHDFYSLPIPIPPLTEQRVIATALSDVDELLAAQEKLIAKKRDIKQAAMQQLLTGKQRLPGFSGEWEMKRLGRIGVTYGGLTGKTKADFADGKTPYIPFMNVMRAPVIDTSDFDYVSLAENEIQNKTSKGDLFFNGSSETPEEVGMCSVLLEEVPNLYLNSFCFGFRFHDGARANGLFFAYWFRCSEGRKVMSVLAQGATRYNIAKSAFLKLTLLLPTKEEQTAIATVLFDMDAELAALEHQCDKTRALKQGMMQELLTGRIRMTEFAWQ